MKTKTKAEKEWLSRVAGLGCIVCERSLGIEDCPALIHHVRHGYGKGQKAPHIGGTIPLCWAHHDAQSAAGYHHAPYDWQKRYGTEKELLDIVNEKLGFDND